MGCIDEVFLPTVYPTANPTPAANRSPSPLRNAELRIPLRGEGTALGLIFWLIRFHLLVNPAHDSNPRNAKSTGSPLMESGGSP